MTGGFWLKSEQWCELYLWTPKLKQIHPRYFGFLEVSSWRLLHLQGGSLFKIQIVQELDEASMRKCAWYIVILRSLWLGAFSSVKVQSEHSQVQMVVLQHWSTPGSYLLRSVPVFTVNTVWLRKRNVFVESANNSEWIIVVEWWGRPLESFHVDHGGICLPPAYQHYQHLYINCTSTHQLYQHIWTIQAHINNTNTCTSTYQLY